jgi:hypothetical protein
MDLESIDLDALDRLRELFLRGSAGSVDYWRSESDLASYDATFGRRIAWKWEFVLSELDRLNWQPAGGTLVDFGCGSGVATRCTLDHFGPNAFSKIVLCDRSRLAMQFAAARVRDCLAATRSHDEVATQGSAFSAEPETALAPDLADATVLISHVLTELSDSQLAGLLDKLANAAAIIWVEPGAREASRGLIDCREKLRAAFHVVAPCTHQGPCEWLAAGNERHWCHHFAHSPGEAFTDGDWARFARLAGIDLRSLPLSWLVLDRRERRSGKEAGEQSRPVRFLGRARVGKAFAAVFGCDETGVRERRLMKRRHPEQFRQLKSGDPPTLAHWTCDGDEIIDLRTLDEC